MLFYLEARSLSEVDLLTCQAVEYEGTLKAKLGIAKKVYLLEKDKVLKSADFSTFFDENKVRSAVHPSVTSRLCSLS